VDAHRRLAYVPGEASLRPSLTGAEKVRSYSKGNRQKVIAGLGLTGAVVGLTGAVVRNAIQSS
jgi:hypothetical protein